MAIPREVVGGDERHRVAVLATGQRDDVPRVHGDERLAEPIGFVGSEFDGLVGCLGAVDPDGDPPPLGHVDLGDDRNGRGTRRRDAEAVLATSARPATATLVAADDEEVGLVRQAIEHLDARPVLEVGHDLEVGIHGGRGIRCFLETAPRLLLSGGCQFARPRHRFVVHDVHEQQTVAVQRRQLGRPSHGAPEPRAARAQPDRDLIHHAPPGLTP